MGGAAEDIDEEALLAEQRDFYRADAEPFDRWLGTLLDDGNEEPVARTYRAGRRLIATVFEQRASLGDVLEIAAGTGRLVGLYLPHATSVVLLDSSPESLALATGRLPASSPVRAVEADVFDWDAGVRTFDTIIFTAWLHHVPHSRFDAFWRRIDSLLAPGGRVIFDYPDARVASPGAVDVPDEPTEDYGFYAPVDGISTRDHLGRRWRVVHNLWDPGDLTTQLSSLGWATIDLGPGLFDNVRWAGVERAR